MGNRYEVRWTLFYRANIPTRAPRKEWFNLFAPRLGVAYRLSDKTVIRTGGGIYYLPSNLQFSEAPWGMPLSSFRHAVLGHAGWWCNAE